MTRQDILNKFEDNEDYENVGEVLDYFEGKFNDLAVTLDIKGLEDLHLIEEARDEARQLARDLY